MIRPAIMIAVVFLSCVLLFAQNEPFSTRVVTTELAGPIEMSWGPTVTSG